MRPMPPPALLLLVLVCAGVCEGAVYEGEVNLAEVQSRSAFLGKFVFRQVRHPSPLPTHARPPVRPFCGTPSQPQLAHVVFSGHLGPGYSMRSHPPLLYASRPNLPRCVPGPCW